jgi:hypothetical protein
MYTANGIPMGKVNVGSRSTPFEYAITLLPVSETVSVTTTCPVLEEKDPKKIQSTEVVCRLP